MRKIKQLKDGSINLLRNTPIEVYIGATIFAALSTFGAHTFEKSRSNLLPLAFSERGQMLRDIEYQDSNVQEMGPWANYLTSTNDAVMKVLEAWDIAHENVFIDPIEVFAKELDIKMNMSKNIYHITLPELLDQLPTMAEKALEGIEDYVNLHHQIQSVINHFDRAWSESHYDHYKTETYTEEECTSTTNSDGTTTRSCTPVMKTRQVYDYTTHTYDYDQIEGEKAQTSLDALLNAFPELRFEEEFPIPSQTNADGEYAAEKTGAMEVCEEDTETIDCFLRVARSWDWGSTIKTRMPKIAAAWSALPNDHKEWTSAKTTAESTSYNTYSQFDSGPMEYQVAKRALGRSRTISNNISEITTGVNYVKGNAPRLKARIEEFVSIVMDGKEGDINEVGNDIIETTKKMYLLNFKEGQDVERYRWYTVLGLGIAGLLLGGLAGKGVDYLAERKGWWNINKRSHQRGSLSEGRDRNYRNLNAPPRRYDRHR